MKTAKQQLPDLPTSSLEKKPKFYTHCPECDRPMDVDQEEVKRAKQFLETLGHDVERLGEDLWAIDRFSSKAQYKISPTLVAYARRIEDEGSQNKHRRTRKGIDSGSIKAHSRRGSKSKSRTLKVQPASKATRLRKTRSDKGKKRTKR